MLTRQISYFMWVYEEGSLRAAAERAKVGQPALSMQLQQLEKELAVQLFKRTNKGVEPTSAARRLYAHCQIITQNIMRARSEMSELAQVEENLSGNLSIGLPPPLSRGILGEALARFMDAYPAVRVSIAEAYTETLTEWVQSGRVDLCIGSRPAEAKMLMQRHIFRDSIVLMSGQPINGPTLTPIDLSQVADLRLILPASKNQIAEIVTRNIEEGTIIASRTVEIDGWVAAHELIQTSRWALFTPYMGVFGLKDQNFYIYPIERPKIVFDLYLIFDQRRPLSPIAMRFVNIIQDKLKQMEIAF